MIVLARHQQNAAIQTPRMAAGIWRGEFWQGALGLGAAVYCESEGAPRDGADRGAIGADFAG